MHSYRVGIAASKLRIFNTDWHLKPIRYSFIVTLLIFYAIGAHWTLNSNTVLIAGNKRVKRKSFSPFYGLSLSFILLMATSRPIHPLVRDLYKRAVTIGHDYPTGIEHVRTSWKNALRNEKNWVGVYKGDKLTEESERELKKAVGRGRFMVREMVGVIQLKKYRTMKKRYNSDDVWTFITVTMMRGSLWRLAFIDASAPGLELIDRESLLGIRLDFDEGLGIKLYTSAYPSAMPGPTTTGGRGGWHSVWRRRRTRTRRTKFI